jgi:type I restriction enzyme S subunit
MSAAKTKHVPALRFKEFTEPWVEKRGRELFGNRRTRGNESLPIYSVTLTKGVVPRDSLARQIGADAAADSHLMAEPGDLIYNMMRMWQGAVGRADVECMISPAYVVLAPTKYVDSKYFAYNLQRARSIYDLWAYSYGLTDDRLRLYYRDFGFIKFHIPLLPEQEKISTVLVTVDNKLETLRRKRELLQIYKRGMLHKIFSQELQFKTDDGVEFPNWQVKRLRELADRITTKNTGSDVSRVLTNSAVMGVVDQLEYFDKDIANSDNLGGYYVLEQGDYVYNPRISVSAPVGPINKNMIGIGVMSPLYTVFRFNSEMNDFYDYYFQSTLWHNYMKSVANYGARHDRMNISNHDLMNMPVPAPHFDEQQKIADFLSAIDAKIDAVAEQIKKMKQFKKGLLQQMFV